MSQTKDIHFTDDEWFPVLTPAHPTMRHPEYTIEGDAALADRISTVFNAFDALQKDLRILIQVQPVMRKVVACLTPDLLRPEYRDHLHPLYGHCYVAAEALYHLIPHIDLEVKPYHGTDDEGITHWWLQAGDLIIDPTAGQYLDRGVQPPYARGVGSGFLTKQPSKRAQVVINRVNCQRPGRRPTDAECKQATVSLPIA